MAGASPMPGQRKWSNNLMFLAAAIGSAVGISNVWKFTYVAGENGGGAFVLVYVLAIAFVALPALIAEFLIGRRGGASVVKTMDNLKKRDGISRTWRYYGQMAALGAFIALSFYSVIAGWTIDYFFRSVTVGFSGITTAANRGRPGRIDVQPWTHDVVATSFPRLDWNYCRRGDSSWTRESLTLVNSGPFRIIDFAPGLCRIGR